MGDKPRGARRQKTKPKKKARVAKQLLQKSAPRGHLGGAGVDYWTEFEN